ncbi:hypothetical protein [Ligilactobacillus equi]|uniref:hypothetical protein n=1 Tax=Ligilactobacillus equi TaxID=137357 RepID=UPI00046ACB13|nr:hypothetical protein [Ligilactobacillus equi]
MEESGKKNLQSRALIIWFTALELAIGALAVYLLHRDVFSADGWLSIIGGLFYLAFSLGCYHGKLEEKHENIKISLEIILFCVVVLGIVLIMALFHMGILHSQFLTGDTVVGVPW